MPVYSSAEVNGDPMTTQWEVPHSKMHSPRMKAIFTHSISELMHLSLMKDSPLKESERTEDVHSSCAASLREDGAILNESELAASHFFSKIRNEVGDLKELYHLVREEVKKECGEEINNGNNNNNGGGDGDDNWHWRSNWSALLQMVAQWDKWHCLRHHGQKVDHGLVDRLQSLVEVMWAIGYSTREGLTLGMGRLMKEILAHIGTPSLAVPPVHRAVIFVGHDSTIMPLLSYFGAFRDSRWPYFAATLTFEVLEREEDENNLYIRLLRDSIVVSLPGLERWIESQGDGEGKGQVEENASLMRDQKIYSLKSISAFVRDHSHASEGEYLSNSYRGCVNSAL